MRRGSLRWLGLFAVLALVMAACEQAPGPAAKPTFSPGTYMADLQKKGSIVIGVKFDVPQFGALNPATGKPEGFDVELGSIIADELGVEAEFVEALSANRIPFLQEDKVDLILSTMTINEERKQVIDFSVVYYVAGQSLLVKKGSEITDVGTLDEAGANVCSARGSTSAKNIQTAAPNAKLVEQGGYAQCFQLLQNDQVQAVTTDDVILLGFLKQDPANFQLTGGRFSLEPYGAGIKKGRTGFVDFVNGIIKDMKADGRWLELYGKWVEPITGLSANPPPDDVKATAPSPPAA